MSKKNAGEFYTPRTIVKLMVELLDPQPGETVYDPACGTGGMLIEAVHHMNNDRLAYGRIFGQEKQPVNFCNRENEFIPAWCEGCTNKARRHT